MRRELCRQATVGTAEQDGIISRRQLRQLGLSRFDVRTEVRAARWHKPSPMTVAVFTGDLSQRQGWWVSLPETGCTAAALDGVTALQAAGLRGYEATTAISYPRGAKPRHPDGAAVHVTEWRRPGDIVTVGVPRVRPAAAVRGALWAGTDRQAALILVLAVQQRLTTAKRLAMELATVQRHPRRRLLNRLIADIADGAQALGELDFAGLCRRHRLPRPSRQVIRRGPHGRAYLDVYFDDYGLVVEIDGIHHQLGMNPVDDALRQNDLTLGANAVLRIPLLGVRLQAGRFMAQLMRGLRDRGWGAAA